MPAVTLPSTTGAVIDAFLREPQIDPRVARRARAIRAVAAGKRRSDAAAASGLSVASLYRWIQRFAREGVTGLLDQPRSGRPCKLTLNQRDQLIRLASEAPAQYGIEQGQWSSTTLTAVFSRQTGLNLHGHSALRADS